MSRITIGDVKTSLGITETYDIVNAIANSSPNFTNYVPLASVDNVTEIGAAILGNQTLQNDFVTALVDRIGLVVVKYASLHNPLKKFKKGQMPQGRTIEEIFTDITKGQKYDVEDAESTVFKRAIPNVKTLFHERNRQDFYEQTIQDDQLKTAFISWNHFDQFVTSILNAIYNSAEVEEYEYMKLVIDNYYAKGLFTVVNVEAPTTATATAALVKKIRATARKMTLPNGSRNFNALAVRARSEMENLHLLIDADLEAEMDVDVLAKAFNMDRTTFLGHVTIIDGFSSTGLECVLVDESWFMVYDNLQKMETIRNPKGLYWNYFYHVWQTLSASRFANAVAFVSGTVPAVTQVIVDPTILAIKPTKTHKYNVYVRATDGEEHDVTWSVAGKDGNTVTSGTTVVDGLLTIAAGQTGELIVKASVDIGTVATPDLVTGESIVTVVQ